MTPFEQAAGHVLKIEGKYSNHASDRGGETMWGITVAVARANGYTGAMVDLTLEQAKAIYKQHYWDTLLLDQVAKLSQPIAEELFDTGVNCGIGVAGRFLQQALNSFNRRGVDYADVLVDGVLGRATVYALSQYLKRREFGGETVMLRALNSLQGARYIDIGESRPANEDFMFGWFLHRVV